MFFRFLGEHITHASPRYKSEARRYTKIASVWLFATERERPLARGQQGLTIKGERSRETYKENADMGRRECMFVVERSHGDRDGTTWVGDQVTRYVCDRRYPQRYRDRRMDGRRQYVCS